jgi:hypothetical protein
MLIVPCQCPDCLWRRSFKISHLRPATIFACPDCLFTGVRSFRALIVLASRVGLRLWRGVLAPAVTLTAPLMCPDCLRRRSFRFSHLRPATIFACPDCLFTGVRSFRALIVLASRVGLRLWRGLLAPAVAVIGSPSRCHVSRLFVVPFL